MTVQQTCLNTVEGAAVLSLQSSVLFLIYFFFFDWQAQSWEPVKTL